MTTQSLGSPHIFKIRPVSHFMYQVIWVTSLPGALTSILELQDEQRLGLSHPVARTFAIASAFLLIMIYFDIGRIEKLQSSDHDYPGWVGSGKRIELILRVLIVVSLLFAVGEFHQILHHGGWFLTRVSIFLNDMKNGGDAMTAIVCALANPPPMTDSCLMAVFSFFQRSPIFAMGSFGAFGFIAWWNLGALKNRWPDYKIRKKNLTRQEHVHYWNVFCRIGFFTALAALTSLYWAFVWFFQNQLADFARYFVVTYFILFFFTMILVIKKISRSIDSLIDRKLLMN